MLYGVRADGSLVDVEVVEAEYRERGRLGHSRRARRRSLGLSCELATRLRRRPRLPPHLYTPRYPDSPAVARLKAALLSSDVELEAPAAGRNVEEAR